MTRQREPDDTWYEIRKSMDNQYYHVHVGANGEIISTGELHPRMSGAVDSAVADGATALPLKYEGPV